MITACLLTNLKQQEPYGSNPLQLYFITFEVIRVVTRRRVKGILHGPTEQVHRLQTGKYLAQDPYDDHAKSDAVLYEDVLFILPHDQILEDGQDDGDDRQRHVGDQSQEVRRAAGAFCVG